jgi:GH24 family phage-related lysozyme (muramidase)
MAENKRLASDAFAVITRHEGFKPEPYPDTNKKWTIGIGTLIGDGSDKALRASPYYGKKIDRPTAEKIATKAMVEKINLVNRLFGSEKFNSFSPELQAQLVSGAYRGDITQSPKAMKLLKQGDFTSAAREYLDFDEYKNADKNKAGGIRTRMDEAAAVIAAEAKKAPAKPVSFADVVDKRFLNEVKIMSGPQ